MELLDGYDFCGWVESIGGDSENCGSDTYGGFLLIPTTEMVGIILQSLKNLRLKFETMNTLIKT